MANTPQSYADQFRSLPPEKLAEIIVGEQDYHPDAVETARLELTARMLPMEELDRLYDRAEAKNIKRETKGYSIGLEKSRKLKSSSTTPDILWLRTPILKIIGAYLFLYFCFVSYKIITPSAQSINYEISGIPLPYLLISGSIILLILGAGIKGSKLAWWGALALFIFKFLGAIENAYNTYKYYVNVEGDTSGIGLGALIGLFADDPLTAGIKLIIPILFLYLLLRKDTRIASRILKNPVDRLDEIDHLEAI